MSKEDALQIVFDKYDIIHVQSCLDMYDEGYRQAKTDLALTWKDIRIIREILANDDDETLKNEDYYKKVLEKYNEQSKRIY